MNYVYDWGYYSGVKYSDIVSLIFLTINYFPMIKYDYKI